MYLTIDSYNMAWPCTSPNHKGPWQFHRLSNLTVAKFLQINFHLNCTVWASLNKISHTVCAHEFNQKWWKIMVCSLYTVLPWFYNTTTSQSKFLTSTNLAEITLTQVKVCDLLSFIWTYITYNTGTT